VLDYIATSNHIHLLVTKRDEEVDKSSLSRLHLLCRSEIGVVAENHQLLGPEGELLSDSLAELGRAWALIGKALAVDIDSRRGRAFGAFFLDLRPKCLGDQQPDRNGYQ
jgi:hypothetical protein